MSNDIANYTIILGGLPRYNGSSPVTPGHNLEWNFPLMLCRSFFVHSLLTWFITNVNLSLIRNFLTLLFYLKFWIFEVCLTLLFFFKVLNICSLPVILIGRSYFYPTLPRFMRRACYESAWGVEYFIIATKHVLV